MKRAIALLSLVLLSAGLLWAQPAAPAGVSAERLARIDTALQKYVDDGRVAGAVALVLRDGKPIYERAVGWGDKEAGRRMAPDTIFRIASQTKAITSAAIMALVEEGKIGITDPASRFIPAFAKTTVAVRSDGGMTVVPARRSITIRDLLTHTSGVSYGTDAHIAALYEAKGLGPAAGRGWYTADKDEPICETMERLATLPFVSHPGEAYVYGYNTDILGCIVERASGQPLDQFIRTRITAPLGMKDTHFFLPAAQKDRLSVVYASGSDGQIVRASEGATGQGHYIDGPRRSFAGGAGLVSTARDYARFLEMIRNGGVLDGVRILAPRTVDLMTTNQIGTLHSTTGLGYGLGFQTTDRYGANGMDSVGAFGWGGAYGSVYRVDPQARLVIVLMIQLMPSTSDIRTTFPTLVYQALTEPAVPKTPSGTSVLFLGNSFTFGEGSAVRFFRSGTVTDLNGEGIGGVPALFKGLADQAGLSYDVSLETRPGSSLDFHLANKLAEIRSRPWDKVVMHGHSTLDSAKPGDPAKLIATSQQLAGVLRERNPKVDIHLMATWSRADQTYKIKDGPWFGKPIDAMARDVRAAYDKAAENAPNVTSVIPVGDAWTRAVRTGVADPNPYDGIDAGKINLWASDHYHASTHGSYLQALLIFGSLTGRDPRSLGDHECVAFELGLAGPEVRALQQVAFDQLGETVTPAAFVTPAGRKPARCDP